MEEMNKEKSQLEELFAQGEYRAQVDMKQHPKFQTQTKSKYRQNEKLSKQNRTNGRVT